MSLKPIPEDLILAQEARALRWGAEVARAVDVRAIASAKTEEARHGKPGTVRDLNAVFVWCVGKAITAARDRGRIREQEIKQDLERYADLWVILLGGAIECRSTPVTLGATLRTFRANGFPKLNPRIAEKLLALGDSWPALALPDAPRCEMTKPRRTRAPREGKRAARADTLPR